MPENQPVSDDINQLEDEATNALMALVYASPKHALQIITSFFVGLVVGVAEKETGEPVEEIKIDGGLSRDITIHAPKKAEV